jgi:hypothetical protein
MARHWYFIGIAFFGMVSGLPFLHPLYLPTFLVSANLMAAPLFGNTSLVALFTSLMVSTAIVILGGIPAAIYERFVGAKDDSTEVSLWIWLAGTAILTLPAMGNFLQTKL